MKTELMDGERLLANELANLFRGWEGVGGRLYVTNRRVIFEPHFLNFQRGVTVIPLEDVADARPVNNLWIIPNGLVIETRDGVRYRFVAWGREQIIDMIHVCKSSVVWDEPLDSPIAPHDSPPVPAIRPGTSVDGTTRPKEP